MCKWTLILIVLAGCVPDKEPLALRNWDIHQAESAFAIARAQLEGAKPVKPVKPDTPENGKCPTCYGTGKSGDGIMECNACNGTGKKTTHSVSGPDGATGDPGLTPPVQLPVAIPAKLDPPPVVVTSKPEEAPKSEPEPDLPPIKELGPVRRIPRPHDSAAYPKKKKVLIFRSGAHCDPCKEFIRDSDAGDFAALIGPKFTIRHVQALPGQKIPMFQVGNQQKFGYNRAELREWLTLQSKR